MTREARIAALGYDYDAQPKVLDDRCNLCGNDTFTSIVHRDRYGYRARAQACNRCGVTKLNPVMTPDAYGKFYNGVYRPLVSAFHGRLIDSKTIQGEQAEYAERIARELAPFMNRPGGRLLDIGGSTGVVAAHFVKALDLKATIIDPAPLEIDVARSLGLDVVSGFVEDYDPGEDKFDFVIMCQTVDHLLDVSGTLAKTRKLIREDGVFFIDVVDFRAAYRRNGSVEMAVKIDHPYSLTQETMEAYLRRAGFRIVAKDFAPDHLHVGFICRPAEAEPDYLPDEADVKAYFAELRAIQNPLPAR